ncbi:MAG: nucleotide exchange factor GrpE [Bdellovibrionota bacterium]
MVNEENDNSSQNEEVNEEQKLSEQMKKDDPASELKAQNEKLLNDMLYLKADFENYKKRMIKERSDVMKYGSENLIVSLLDLLDNFERAMSMEITPENVKSFSDGINMISSEFKNVLNRFGVTEVKALGQNFDPSHHEAMGTEPTDEYKPGTISKVFTKPYKLHDRLIRPGKVIIAQEAKQETNE